MSGAQRWAGQHNYALRQIAGALGVVRQQQLCCPSLTPAARLHMQQAILHLVEAEKEIRARRVEPFGTIKEFPRDRR